METTSGPGARPSGVRHYAGDVALAVVFTAFSVAVTHAIARDSTDRYDGWALLAIVLIGASLAARRVAPITVLVLQTVALGVYTWVGFAGGPIYLAPMVMLFTIAAEGDRRRTWWTAGGVMVAFLAIAVTSDDPRGHIAYLATFGGWAAGALFLGRATANRRQYLDQLERRARALEDGREEEARRRVAEERLRIARDLHDAVAHGIATIHLRAGAALHVLERNPDEAARALTAIKEVSKDTLDELRATLGMLRSDGEDAPLAPTPGLDRLDELVEATRRTGVTVDVDLDPAIPDGRRPVPLAADVAAYRIVQESLTNVMKHAGAGARVTLRVRADDAALYVEVADDGRGPAVEGSATPTGHGVAGMRERATAIGGTLTTGRRPGGGYRVHAVLPLTGAPAGAATDAPLTPRAAPA